MKKYRSSILFFAAACVILFVTVMVIQQQMQAKANRPIPTQKESIASPDVSVISVSPASYFSEVSAFGSADPHFSISLTSQVAGQIEQISADFENGKRVKKGITLAQLENSNYQAAVESARQILSAAKVSLLEEERQGMQALAEWQSSGLKGEPDSDLVLRKPQLEAAKASVKNAQASLKSAEKDLARSMIKAPFDALIINRAVSLGSYIQTGTEVATLYSTDRVEISVALSSNEWQNLPPLSELNEGSWPVTISSVENQQQWNGFVLRAEQSLDAQTRQRSLIVALKNPLDQKPALYPGTFVNVHISGRKVDGLWKLPTSALSQRGEIWYVDKNNTLAKFSTTPLFTRTGFIFVEPPEDLKNDRANVLINPLDSYLNGMDVKPVEVTP